MTVEGTAFRLGLAALAVSAGNAHLRRVEELRRRASSPLVRLIDDGAGGCIELAVNSPEAADGPVVVFETGLGACLDGWDWLVQLLGSDYWLVRYHRRGHGRTRSRARPWSLVVRVLQESDLGGRPLHFVGHSLGGLIIANNLYECADLAAHTSSVTLIDATDADLLAAERLNAEKTRRFRQHCFQEGLASATGLGRWTLSPVESEVNLRASAQRAFLTESSRPRTLLAAVREHMAEPLEGQGFLSSLDIPKMVVAASDNVVQQRRLADKLDARFEVVPDSSHRAVIGQLASARVVADLVRGFAR